MLRQNTPSRPGLTLVELIAAAAVAAILASAAVGVLSRLLRAREVTAARAQAVERSSLAAERIASDVLHVSRDRDLVMTKLTVVDGGTPRAPRDELLVLTRTLQRVRPAEEGPEGGEVEAQYRVAESISPETASSLWRRADPGFDRALDAGGVATPIVPGVVSLQIEAYDGADWFADWESDSYGLPHALRITVVAESDRQGRRAGSRSTARRVVAIDRAPLPLGAATEDTGASATPSGGTESSVEPEQQGQPQDQGQGDGGAGQGEGAGRDPGGNNAGGGS